MKRYLQNILINSLAKSQKKSIFPTINLSNLKITITSPNLSKHGDFSTNIALQLSKQFQLKPLEIAKEIIEHIDKEKDIISKIEIAKPGFINFYINPQHWLSIISKIITEKEFFGTSNQGKNQKILIEFVSANPTGPLHIGHGRGAVIGDVLARILRSIGHKVETEYYINDAGNQMVTLAQSILYRMDEQKKQSRPIPQNYYQGKYILDLAKEAESQHNEESSEIYKDKTIAKIANWAGEKILKGIKKDLISLGIKINNYCSEKKIINKDILQKTLKILKKNNLIYEKEKALWFASSMFNDDKDRVLKKSDGKMTYFANDLIYHYNKFERGFDLLINVWGSDHHGYVPRIKAGIKALGKNKEYLKIILVQMVNLLNNNTPVNMSTRSGEFITLEKVINEVGRDVTRFIFLTIRSDSPLDFDLAIAKQNNLNNPLYYIQYAHTRITSILNKASIIGLDLKKDINEIDINTLKLDKEITLAKNLYTYPEIVLETAQTLKPHRIIYFLTKLSNKFHSYYDSQKILQGKSQTILARLLLIKAIKQVLKNGLDLLGISAPEIM